MHRLSVKLPEEDPVDTFLFSRIVSRAIVALACDPHATLVTELFESKVTDIKVGEAEMQTTAALTVEDRRLLREILPDLPPLTIASGESARVHFREQWKQHPKAPPWRPYLPTEGDQAVAAFQATLIQGRHLDQLQEWLDRGMFRAFDRHRLSASEVGLNVYISRADAERYLEDHGMDVAGSTLESRSDLLFSIDTTKRNDAIAKGNERAAARVHGVVRNSSGARRDTVDGLLNSLIDAALDEFGPGARTERIVDEVIANFIDASKSMPPRGFLDIRGKGAKLEIHRQNDTPISHEAIRGRVRTRQKKRRDANAED